MERLVWVMTALVPCLVRLQRVKGVFFAGLECCVLLWCNVLVGGVLHVLLCCEASASPWQDVHGGLLDFVGGLDGCADGLAERVGHACHCCTDGIAQSMQGAVSRAVVVARHADYDTGCFVLH